MKFTITTLLSMILLSGTQAQVYMDPTADIDDRVSDLLSKMSLAEKVHQMIMDAENTDEGRPGLGAYLIAPSGLEVAPDTPADWRWRMNQLQQQNNWGEQFNIPLLICGDAVHGNNMAK